MQRLSRQKACWQQAARATSLLEQTLRVVGDTAFDWVVEQARHNSDSWSMARAKVISGQA
jgi:hypothetical protein